MSLICICCFVTLVNKNVFLSTSLDFPVILDWQFYSIVINNKTTIVTRHLLA
jgi:hypothetical protein